MIHGQLAWITGIIIALAGAPILPGIINKIKALFAGRKGPSLFQLYYDIAKLLHKDSVYSNTCTWVFRYAPIITLSTLLAAMTLLPYAGIPSPLGFAGDLILYLYLCGTGRFFTVIGALDTGSSFEGMGASRECQFAVFAEGAMLTVFGALILLTKNFSLSGILFQMDTKMWSVDGTALLLIAVVVFIVILVECCRVPMDDPDTHLELTMIHEAMILDNSGPDLGIIHYAASLKLWVLLLVETLLIFPRYAGNAWIELTIEITCVLFGTILIGIVESVIARFRFLKIPQILSGAICAGLLAIVLLLLF